MLHLAYNNSETVDFGSVFIDELVYLKQDLTCDNRWYTGTHQKDLNRYTKPQKTVKQPILHKKQ